ncbi:MAG: hypothetical protein ABIT38_14040, partial [Gemmatimonadaceae bacterium]
MMRTIFTSTRSSRLEWRFSRYAPLLAVVCATTAAAQTPASSTFRATRSARSSSPNAMTDTMRLYYVGYAVGYERWSIAPGRDGKPGEQHFTTDLDYVDRGRRTHLRTDAQLAADWSPTLLET